jgi:hypothetical protein
MKTVSAAFSALQKDIRTPTEEKVYLYIQYPFKIIEVSGVFGVEGGEEPSAVFTLDGNASSLLAIGDIITFSKRPFTSESIVSSVVYSESEKNTTIELTTGLIVSADIGGYVRKKMDVTDRIEGEVGGLNKALEGQALNIFSSGQVSVTFNDEDRYLYDAINESGLVFFYECQFVVDVVTADSVSAASSIFTDKDLIGYTLLLATGDGGGRKFPIVSNTSSSVVVAANDFDLTDLLVAGDTVSVMREDKMYVQILSGYASLLEYVPRFIGVLDVGAIGADIVGDKIKLEFRGLLEELRNFPSFNVVDKETRLARIPAITLVGYSEPTTAVVYGVKILNYEIVDTKLEGLSIGRVSCGLWPGVYSLRYRPPNWFSFDYGQWRAVNLDNLSGGMLRLNKYGSASEWIDLDFSGIDTTFVGSLFPNVVAHEELIWIEGPERDYTGRERRITRRHMWTDEYSPRSGFFYGAASDAARKVVNMGIPQITFDGGEPISASMLAENVWRYNTGTHTWTDIATSIIRGDKIITFIGMVSDYIYFVSPTRFWGLSFIFASVWSGTPVIEVACSLGESLYETFTSETNGLVDGTDNFKLSGLISWNSAENWKSGTLRISSTEAVSGYIIRVRATTFGTGTLEVSNVRKLIKISGKDGDVVTLAVDMNILPSGGIDDNIIVFDDDGVASVGTWRTSVSAGTLCDDLLDSVQFGLSPVTMRDAASNLDETELSSSMVVGLGYAPRPFNPKRANCLCVDDDDVYVGVDDEIWVLSNLERYEYIGRIVITEDYPASQMKIRKIAVSGDYICGIAFHDTYRRLLSLGSAEVLGCTFRVLKADRGVVISVHDTDIFPCAYSMRQGHLAPYYDDSEITDYKWKRRIGTDVGGAYGSFRNGGENLVLPFSQTLGCRWSVFIVAVATGLYFADGLFGDGVAENGGYFMPLAGNLYGANVLPSPMVGDSGPYYDSAPVSLMAESSYYMDFGKMHLRFTYGQDGFVGWFSDGVDGGKFAHFAYVGATMGKAWTGDPAEPPGFLWYSDVNGDIENYNDNPHSKIIFPTLLEQALCGCVDSVGRIFLGHISWTEKYSGLSGAFVSVYTPNLDLPTFDKIYVNDEDLTDVLGGAGMPGGSSRYLYSGDYIYIGCSHPFLAVYFAATAAGASVGTIQQLCDDGSWYNIPAGSDGSVGAYDLTEGLTHNGDMVWRSTKGNIDNSTHWVRYWAKRTFKGGKLYWVKIPVTATCQVSRIANRWATLWHSFDVDVEASETYDPTDSFLPISLAYNEAEDAVHVCFWNRDCGGTNKTGWSSADTLAQSYIYGVVTHAITGGGSFEYTTEPSGTLDYVVSKPLLKLKYNPNDSKVYGIYTDVLFGEDDAKLVKITCDHADEEAIIITMDSLGRIGAGEKFLAGELEFTADAVWGIGGNRSLLWRYGASFRPYVFLADFQEESCLDSIEKLLQMFNALIYANDEGYIRLMRRGTYAETIDISGMEKSFSNSGLYEHKYASVSVSWESLYGETGSKIVGERRWNVDELAISNSLIQDETIAEVVSRILYTYFSLLRKVTEMETTSCLESEVFDLLLSSEIDNSIANFKRDRKWIIVGIKDELSKQTTNFSLISLEGE